MSILIKPIITEKANNDSELNNRYTFQVEKNANKVQIKEAVGQMYLRHSFVALRGLDRPSKLNAPPLQT